MVARYLELDGLPVKSNFMQRTISRWGIGLTLAAGLGGYFSTPPEDREPISTTLMTAFFLAAQSGVRKFASSTIVKIIGDDKVIDTKPKNKPDVSDDDLEESKSLCKHSGLMGIVGVAGLAYTLPAVALTSTMVGDSAQIAFTHFMVATKKWEIIDRTAMLEESPKPVSNMAPAL